MNSDYSSGTPCWVDTVQPEPIAAMRFYGALLGWSFNGPEVGPDRADGNYYTARLAGRPVAGVGQAPAGAAATWRTHVCVDDVGQAVTRTERAGGTLTTDVIDAGPAGYLASITDSTGIPLHLWQPGARQFRWAERTGEPNTWAMSSLHTPDVQRARDFYGTVFGWELETIPNAPFSRWRLNGRIVAVVTATDGITAPQHWGVNFLVRDADAIAQQATTLGGLIVMAPMNTPGLRSAVIADPHGGFVAISAEDDAGRSATS